MGRPVGVIPLADAVHSCVIAANALAKRNGVKTGTSIAAARLLCPGVALVAQQPDLYVRVHQRIVAAILDVLPIDAICSIDELVASIEDRDSPVVIAQQVKRRVRDAVGDRITCSIGCAPNGTVKLSRICPFCGRILLDQRLRINDLAVAAGGENAAKLLNLTVPIRGWYELCFGRGRQLRARSGPARQ